LKIDDCIAADDGHLVEFCVTQGLFANIVTEPVSVELEEEKVITYSFIEPNYCDLEEAHAQPLGELLDNFELKESVNLEALTYYIAGYVAPTAKTVAGITALPNQACLPPAAPPTLTTTDPQGDQPCPGGTRPRRPRRRRVKRTRTGKRVRQYVRPEGTPLAGEPGPNPFPDSWLRDE
jgi:hypothetical protein